MVLCGKLTSNTKVVNLSSFQAQFESVMEGQNHIRGQSIILNDNYLF